MAVSAQTVNFRRDVPALGPERPLEWPARQRKLLGNGLEVVLVESHAIPKFHGELFFRSGNADANTGVADMAATVARTGTTRRASHQIEDDLRSWGADLGTQAGADTSAISFAGLSEFAPKILELVAELATEASFPADEFERERRQKLEELAISRTTPDFLASERIRKVMYGEHPYANYAPTAEQVSAWTRETLVSYYREHWRPARALLVIVGDFASAKMMDDIEGVFGKWTGPEGAHSARPNPPRRAGRKVYLVHLPGAVQAQIVTGNKAITRKHPDWLRLSLTNNIYGGAFNSRLVANIREQKGYTYSPRSGTLALREYGMFNVSAAVRNEVVAATLTEIFYELDRIRALPVSDAELANAQNYMCGVFSLQLGTQEGVLGQLTNVLMEELPEDYLETFRGKIRAMTTNDVLGAARKYFDSANTQIVVVGDKNAIGEQAALFGEVETFDANGNRI
jgi:zinc protease